MSRRWDDHFLSLCLEHAWMSKDPSTQVGCVIVGPDKEPISNGFNGFPRGIKDSFTRLHDRDTKLKIIVHAEMNALMNACRSGHSTKGATLYVAATSLDIEPVHTCQIWGGPPCTRCTVHVIQAGIVEVVTYPKKNAPSRWHDDLIESQKLLEEAGVRYREVNGVQV